MLRALVLLMWDPCLRVHTASTTLSDHFKVTWLTGCCHWIRDCCVTQNDVRGIVWLAETLVAKALNAADSTHHFWDVLSQW